MTLSELRNNVAIFNAFNEKREVSSRLAVTQLSDYILIYYCTNDCYHAYFSQDDLCHLLNGLGDVQYLIGVDYLLDAPRLTISIHKAFFSDLK